MSILSSLLRSVPKDTDGFESIDHFWIASEKLTFPLDSRVKDSLFKSATLPPAKKTTPQKVDSDVEFNYDTSSTISDDEEDDDEEEEEESDSNSDLDGDNNEQSPSAATIQSKRSSRGSVQSSVYSPLNASLGTVGLSPLGTTNSSIRESLISGVDGSNISGRESILSRGTPTTSASASARSSLAPGSSGRKSEDNSTVNSTVNTTANTTINSSRHSMSESEANSSRNTSRQSSIAGANTTVNTTVNTSRNSMSSVEPLSPHNNSRYSISAVDISRRSEAYTDAGEGSESGFLADRSGDMDDTSGLMDVSRRHSTATTATAAATTTPTSSSKSRRASVASDSLTTPAGSANKSRVSLGGGGSDPSILLTASASTKGNRSGDRRVSFSKPELEDLSPIAGTGSAGSKRSLSRTHNTTNNSNNTSHNTSRNTSHNTSRNTSHNTSRNSSSRRSDDDSAEAESEQEVEDTSQAQSRTDSPDFGEDYAGEEAEFDESSDPDNSVSRIASQTDTPITNKSMSASKLSDSGLRTPYSEANNSSYQAGSSSRNNSNNRSNRYSLGATPGSHDFTRGYQLPDETFVQDDASTDEENENLDMTGITDSGGSHKSGKGRSKGKHRAVTDEDDDLDASNEALSVSFIDKDFLHTIGSSNKKYQRGREVLKQRGLKKHLPRGKLYTSDDENDPDHDQAEEKATSEEDSEAEGPRRRSKRATKGQRFAFWKGERPIYEEGTVVGVVTVDPTPQKRKRVTAKVTEDGKNKRAASKKARTESDEEGGDHVAQEHLAARPLPKVKLPKSVQYLDRRDCESLDVWDEVAEAASSESVFCSIESLMPASALPQTAQRPPGRNKVGFAAHSFNVPEVPGQLSGWLSGFIDLPSEAIKDAEGVGKFTQMFFVSDCQDGALELGLASPDEDKWVDRTAQRILLKKGDCFYVPPGNIYRLENHSTVKSSMLHWVIIKPIEMQLDGTPLPAGDEASVSMDVSPTSTDAVLNGKVLRPVHVDMEQ